MKKRFTILSILLCILMISGAAMTATHAAKKKKIRHKQTPEQLFSLKKSDLDGLLIPAAEYGVEYGFLADYGFILYNNGGIPTPVVFETYIDEDGYDREAVVGQVPVEERKIDTRYLYEEDERLSDLTRVVETLSAHRAQIDFEALYRDFGWILRKALSRADYEKRYAPTVEMLLAVYDDLRANAELYGVTEAVMQAHWEQTLDNSYVGLPDYCPEFKQYLSDTTLAQLTSFFCSNNTDYENDYMIIWSYSFWLRRRGEGKTEEVYRTLCAIRNDYCSE